MKGNKPMKTITSIIHPAFALFAFACFGLLPQARATCQDACLTNNNTVQGDDALISLTSGAENTAVGSSTLDSNTTGSDNALASWIWRRTGGLHVPCFSHTATLLQNG